ncbi:MAG: glycosyltransferase family 4 protein [Verrucomicrobiales bacterium]
MIDSTSVAPKSVCIVAHNSYGAMLGGDFGHIGGAERQTTLMANWLTARKVPVSLVTWGARKKSIDETIAGVRIVKLCTAREGLPGLRFLHPRLTSLFSALKRSKADVFYHNSAEASTGLVALWCRMNKKKFVYSIASDLACLKELPALAAWHEKKLYRFGLSLAQQIVVQTARQKELLRQNFGVDATVVPMPCPMPVEIDASMSTPPPRPLFIWVGRLVRLKRLEIMFDVAEDNPKYDFWIAAANDNKTEYSQSLSQRASTIKNVRWLGAVPREEMPFLYNKAVGLCCTSTHEGFPNTFLESWSFGKPVISSFDPDNIIKHQRLGYNAETADEFSSAIRQLAESKDLQESFSRRCRAYFCENHHIDKSMERFQRILVDC